MQIRSKDGRNVELRGRITLSKTTGRPILTRQNVLTTQRNTSENDAIALPAILFCVRFISQTAGFLKLEVCKRDERGHITVVHDAPQSRLLGVRPNAYTTPSQLVAGCTANVQGYGNAIWQKFRDEKTGEIIELHPVGEGSIKVEAPTNYGQPPRYFIGSRELAASEVIHFSGWNWAGQFVGRSPLQICMDAVNLGLTSQELGIRYMENNGQLGGILSGPEDVDDAQVEYIKDVVVPSLQGKEAAGQIGVTSGGWKFEKLGVDLESAQWAENAKISERQIAQMFGVPYSFLNPEGAQWSSTEQEAQHFLNYCLGPITKEFCERLLLDEELFPADSGLFPRFDTSSLLAVDFKVLAEAIHKLTQSGVATSNEGRERLNLPWHPDGDVLQITPVGGESNPGIDQQDKAA